MNKDLMTTYTIDLNRTCDGCGCIGCDEASGLCLTCLGARTDSTTPPAAQHGQRAGIDRSNRPTGRGLAGSLFDLILRAERANDQKFHSLPLPNGLYIEIGIGQQFNLRMYRKTSAPSSTEWQTVIKNLPPAYQPQSRIDHLPRNFRHTERDGSIRWYLEGHWPFPARG